MPHKRTLLIWGGLSLVVLVPVVAATLSPLLQWRQPIYITAGFAGVIGMALLFLQPLFAAGLIPGARGASGRGIHRYAGLALVSSIIIHVGGLWITSPPDVIDALTFRSPTSFAIWGVAAMWAAFAAATLALFRRRLGLRIWRIAHTSLVIIVVIGTVLHAILIDGTMETVSKYVLALAVLGATGLAIVRMKAWMMIRKRRPNV